MSAERVLFWLFGLYRVWAVLDLKGLNCHPIGVGAGAPRPPLEGAELRRPPHFFAD